MAITPNSKAMQDWSGEIQSQYALAPLAPVTLNLNNYLTPEEMGSPMTREESYLSSMRGILQKNKGNYIIANFLIGTTTNVSWEGILYEVGNDYLVIHQTDYGRYIVGDLYALKFVEFPEDQTGATRVGYHRNDGISTW